MLQSKSCILFKFLSYSKEIQIFSAAFMQVANYCRERIHVALAEEIEAEKVRLSEGSVGGNFDELWKKAFTNCFLKVDGLIGEANEPVAPETVGSTAVVAI